ncbi:hypothetical protein X275_05225 [Marinitoga sp. 1197]|uniref:hypothetical protein n=1 Tax=Marinitoga sp. 1197 TaxID=1428449 RepID=UPI000640E1AA|nr:hypothetical protein [Marinitoga sp. 1197]KLO22733.1 hypothetical protein X275_05225 [Marinitoga sp. 1197]
MPSILAHILYATKIQRDLWGSALYLGAQGPDVFFYVNELKYIEIGSKLHKLKSTDYKTILRNFPDSFYYGFISHMELDEKLHGLINSYYSETISHTKFEYNFDELLSLRIFGIHFIEHKWWKILKIKEIEKISNEFDRILKVEFGVKEISYKYAYKKMLKNLKKLFKYPYFKENFLVKILKFLGKDYTYLYPRLDEKTKKELLEIEKEFFLILKGD